MSVTTFYLKHGYGRCAVIIKVKKISDDMLKISINLPIIYRIIDRRDTTV